MEGRSLFLGAFSVAAAADFLGGAIGKDVLNERENTKISKTTSKIEIPA